MPHRKRMDYRENTGMDGNKSSPRRGRVPRYHRSAYKIFLQEKIAEIITLRLQAYDESMKKNSRSMNLNASTLSFPQLAAEVHQIWKGMSTRERDKFKARAVLESKRQRLLGTNSNRTIVKEKEYHPKEDTTSEHLWPLNSDTTTVGTFEDLDTMVNDLYDDIDEAITELDSVVTNSDPLVVINEDLLLKCTYNCHLTNEVAISTEGVVNSHAPHDKMERMGTTTVATARDHLPQKVHARHPSVLYQNHTPTQYAIMGSNNKHMESSHSISVSAASSSPIVVGPITTPTINYGSSVAPPSLVPYSASPGPYSPFPYFYPHTGLIQSSMVYPATPSTHYYYHYPAMTSHSLTYPPYQPWYHPVAIGNYNSSIVHTHSGGRDESLVLKSSQPRGD